MTLGQFFVRLDDLAARWADARYVKTNKALRETITVLAADNKLLKQQIRRVISANKSLGQINRSYQEIRAQAERDRDAARERVIELEQAAVAADAKPAAGDWFADVAAVSGHRCPEGVVLNGDVENVVRCNLSGGHDGNHQGDRHEWPQVEVDDSCEVPW